MKFLKSLNKLNFSEIKIDFIRKNIVNIKHIITDVKLNTSATDLSFYLATGLFTTLLLWAFIFEIDKSINVKGELSPKGRPVIIQNRFEGKVLEIIVEAGQKVTKGDVLVKFETLTDASSFSENIAENQLASVELRRLKAQIKLEDDFEKIDSDNISIFNDQKRLLASEINKFNSDKEILLKELRLNQIKINNIENNLSNLLGNKNLIESKFSVMDQLYKKGYEGEIAFLEAKQELSDINAKLRQTELEKDQLLTESELINQRLRSLTIEFEKTTSQELSEAQRIFDLTSIRQSSLNAKINEYTIIAPLDGTISKLMLENPGEVISAGTVLYELIPEGVEIVFYAQIPVASVNDLKIGQNANIVLATMDTRKDKPLNAKVTYVEEDSTEDENGLKFYSAFLSFSDLGDISLIPGVDGNASILMGRRSVIDYFLEPIFASMQGALSEN